MHYFLDVQEISAKSVGIQSCNERNDKLENSSIITIKENKGSKVLVIFVMD